MSRRCCLLLVVCCSAVFARTNTAVAQATTIYNVFNMPAGDTSLQFVNVGDPGNVADTAVMNTTSEDILNINGSPDHSTGYGSVSYDYAIGTYDVTAAQYVQFLNAVATTGDPYGLYNPLMGGATSGPASSDPKDPIGTTAAWVTISSVGKNWPVVCGITRTGTAGHYSYALSTSAAANLCSPPIPADNGNFPVNWDNWGDAARFCNWLQNGQPTGPEGPATTETGAYALNGATTVAQLFAVTQNSGAKYWIPTENEWYKAAYYKSGGTNAGYWTYTTKNNIAPSSTLSTIGTNNANFNNSGLQSPNHWILTPVGYYAGSPGPYGTYDQGGDLYDFTSTPVKQSSDGTGEGLYVYVMRGGSFHKSSAMELDSDYRTGADPAKYGHGRTFRIATTFTTAQWSGRTAGGNWSTMTNWSGDAAPYAGIALQFGALTGGSASNHNDFAASTSFNGIVFTSAAPSYNLQGNAIDLAGPLQNSSSNSQTVGLDITLVAGGGTFNTAAGNITITGALSGGSTEALVKSGTGTLTLAGSNTYTGPTTINQGELVVNGLLGSPVTVSSGGTLGGTGYLSSGTVNAGGTLAPGDSGGVLHLNGNLVLAASAAMDYELDSPGSGYDQLEISGLATLNGTLNVNLLSGFTPSAGQSFDLITGATTGSFAEINLPSLSGGLSWDTSNLYITGTINVVPESSTLAFLGVGALGLLGYARRRRLVPVASLVVVGLSKCIPRVVEHIVDQGAVPRLVDPERIDFARFVLSDQFGGFPVELVAGEVIVDEPSKKEPGVYFGLNGIEAPSRHWLVFNHVIPSTLPRASSSAMPPACRIDRPYRISP
ncbi:MAG: SUMF1/EgtB/PvdO family nonheme iron enzyme [Thermoguttaceae bacterium]